MKNWIETCGRWMGPAIISSMMLAPVACSVPTSGGDDGANASSGATSQSAAPTVKYDGETLMRGVVFATGPAASLADVAASAHVTPDDPRLSPASLNASLSAAVTRLEASGAHDRAAEVASLRDRILSGEVDEAQIRQAVASVDASIAAGDFANEVIASLRAEDPSYFDRFATEMYSGDHVRVSAALDDPLQRVLAYQTQRSTIGGERILGVLIAIAVVAVVVALALWDMPNADVQGLQHDERIDRLVSRLSAAQ